MYIYTYMYMDEKLCYDVGIVVLFNLVVRLLL